MAQMLDFALESGWEAEGARIRVTGDLDAYSAPHLRRLVDELLDRPAVRMTIDLSDTSFVDSIGLGVLVGAWRRLRAHGGQLVLDSPGASVCRVLMLTGIAESIPIVNGPDEVDDLPCLRRDGAGRRAS